MAYTNELENKVSRLEEGNARLKKKGFVSREYSNTPRYYNDLIIVSFHLNRGTPQIEVTFEVDANGVLNVKAEDKAGGKSEKITITNDYGYTMKLQRTKSTTRTSLQTSLNLEKEKIETAVKEALEWLDENQSAEKDDYDEKLKEVEAVCNPIITAVYQRSGGACKSLDREKEKMRILTTSYRR
ncbi:hypothetical protein IFM89_031570 [Coptis chinensis]|uniref:Heat shock protein 70 n=1 Tax=Coptis chinensis TaxID=261450 RepID=A0A835LX85_9MAGN|nr:hypothetical protein IFM89_031570 [Coptis chinensis]